MATDKFSSVQAIETKAKVPLIPLIHSNITQTAENEEIGIVARCFKTDWKIRYARVFTWNTITNRACFS